MRNYTYNEVIKTIPMFINVITLYLILLIVIEDMPLRSYFIDPLLALVQRYPSLIAYLLIFAIISILIEKIIIIKIKIKELN